MEVMTEEKKGFKQTDIGLIPDDWEVIRLGKLAEIQRGASPRPISDPKWFSNIKNVGWVRISDVTKSDGKYLYSTRDYLSEEGMKRSRFLKAGNLIMSIAATVGLPVITKMDLCIHDGFVGFWNLRDVNQEFLYYKLKFHESDLIEEGQTGSQNNINSDIVRNFEISFPPLAEQQAIATALSEVDELIRTLDWLIEKKEAIKKGTMQQLLTGNKRLPGFDEEWEEKKLGDLVEKIIGGGTPSRSNSKYWNGDIPWATVKDFKSFNLFKTQEYISKEGLLKSSSNLVPKGTVITSTRMGLGEAVIYDVDVSINQDLKAIFTNRKLLSEYLLYWFEANKENIQSLGSGSTVKGISLTDLKGIDIYISDSIEEQQTIAQILSDMDEELQVLRRKREKMVRVKEGMMQELLTGKTRLI